MDHDALRAAYSRFLAGDRILLTGHSHQAWPDVARDAQLAAFDDAARDVDDKWEGIFALRDQVSRGIATRMGFAPDTDIAFGESSHQLVYRLLSALPRDAKVVSTTGEFHSLYRQLRRLQEDGLRVTWVAGTPRATLSERVIAAIDDDTDLVALSAVMFEDAWIASLDAVIERSVDVGAIPLVDAYHAFNIVPLSWSERARDHVYVTAGGYKYAGFGNGLCWLRLPPNCALRPAYTGWFADFANLAEPRDDRPVGYGPGADRFGGATFDASALYRARAVLAHWDAFALDVPALRRISIAQTRRIIEKLAPGTELVSSRADERRGGFVTVRHAAAGSLVRGLRERGVYVDARGDLLRIGPAPYLRDDEIDAGVAAFNELAQA